MSKICEFDMIYKSEAMRLLIEQAEKCADSGSNVLITGESGAGKDVLAKYIHNSGKRRNKPYIEISCSGIPNELLEIELFGCKKGAFTGAVSDRKGKFSVADGGTILLDEIGELNINVQAKILRVLQEKKITPLGSNESADIDVRIIAATNKNLESLVSEGKFRLDLYYRLNVVNLEIPPLRSRKEDIPELARFFLTKYNSLYERKCKISESALKKISEHCWPGNIRELENMMERLIVVSNEDKIFICEDIQFNKIKTDDIFKNIAIEELSLEEAELAFKKKFIIFHLQRNNWNITKTAAKLKIQRSYLSRLVAKLQLK